MSNEIVKKEIRFAWHLPANSYREEDLHYIREDITYKDGRVEPKTYFIENWQRPVWVSKLSERRYKDKKEFMEREKLIVQKTTQSALNRTVANLLEQPHLATQTDAIKNSPYVYGYDITSTSLIKLTTLRKNDFVQSPYSVAVFDIETNPRTDEILMITIAFKGKTHTALLKKFVKNIPDPNTRIRTAIGKFLPKYKDMEATFTYHENEVDMLKDLFKVANDWAPAFLCAWNIDFDLSKILDCLKRHNVNPVDVICDQAIPRKMRVCRYKQGLKKKVTASGVVKPINPSLQWHTLICTSKFYMIDAMCVYRQLRIAKAEMPSYSLDSILKFELDTQKLKFEAAEKYKGVYEHIFLQENYPIEYIVYNLYDCLSMLELDAKTKDISSKLPVFSGITDFQKFNSQVRKITDALFLFGLEKGLIIGTAGKVPDEIEEAETVADELLETDEDDENNPDKYKTLGLSGWIQLLPQNMLLHSGLKCLEDYPDVVTNIRGITYDLDATSSYPSCTQAGNVSKATCVNEMISVGNVPEKVFREQNLAICLGSTNLLEYYQVIHNLPRLDEVDDILKEMETLGEL